MFLLKLLLTLLVFSLLYSSLFTYFGLTEYEFTHLGIHAREWIAPAATTYIIKQLVERSGENEDLIDFYDFYILPVANPDG